MIVSTIVASLSAGLINLRRSNPKLSAAMTAVTNLDLTCKMINDLVKGAENIAPATSRDEADLAVYASLSAGEGLPADTLDRYAAAAAAERAFMIAHDNLSGLYARLVSERDTLLMDGLPTMCGALNDDLQRIYGEMRELRPAPSTAEQAIAEGKVAQFKKMTALRAEYFQIRAAQKHLLASGISRNDDEVFQHLSKGWPIIAHASGLGAVWPKLPEWHKYGKEQVAGGRLVKLTPPWPDPDSEAFLDWLLDHPEAGPWVPTHEQATTLLNQIATAAPTYYETTRSSDQEELAREYERRQRMWGSNSPAHVIN